MGKNKALRALAIIALVVVGSMLMGATILPLSEANVWFVSGNWKYNPSLGYYTEPGKFTYVDTTTWYTTPAFKCESNKYYYSAMCYADTSVYTADDSFNFEFKVYGSTNADFTDTVFYAHDSMLGKAGAGGIGVLDSVTGIPPDIYLKLIHHCHLDTPDTCSIYWLWWQPIGTIW